MKLILGIIPIEINATATPTPGMAKAIGKLREDIPNIAPRGFVVHLGDSTLPLGNGVVAMPIGAVWGRWIDSDPHWTSDGGAPRIDGTFVTIARGHEGGRNGHFCGAVQGQVPKAHG